MGFLDFLAKLSVFIPTVNKPARKPSLYRRLLITAIVLILYLVMAEIPLYGVKTAQQQSQIYLYQVIFATSTGTLMELGIGPIVTAGLILQILVGAKLINLDLSQTEDRKKFTAAQRSLAILFGLIEALAFVLASRYWPYVGNPLTGSEASWAIRIGVVLQLTFATILVLIFDEMLQKGWGVGSAISLFILAGVAKTIFWDLFGYTPQLGQHVGFIPNLIQSISNGKLSSALIRNGLPDLVGLVGTASFIVLLVYLQGMRVEIPIASQTYRGVRGRVPLQFIYVTNIPVLLVGIVVSNFQVFRAATQALAGTGNIAYKVFDKLTYYLSPPRGLLASIEDPVKLAVFVVSWFVLGLLFGYLWVEIAGLNPREQADRLIKGGLDIPGIRRNPKAVESLLARYIYPLTILSSIIVVGIAILADILGAYGSGTGILLAVGIINQYYALIAKERALEAYPILRRVLGEE
jgi:preprotein translocase subunit SecY